MEAPTREKVISRFLQTAVFEPISPVPLAVFRLVFSVILILEVLQLISRGDLLYLENPLQEVVPSEIVILLGMWVVALVGLAVGFLTRMAACVNYLCTVILLQPTALFEYHADLIYIAGSLLLAILPVGRSLSLDSVLLKKIWHRDLSRQPSPRIFNNATIYLLLGLVYFDSTFFKLTSEFWRGGLGLWLPASIPGMTTSNWNYMLNWELCVKFAGCLTVIFEALFLFIYWIPVTRLYLSGIGLALHLGITILFPIPLFGAIGMAVYILLLPDPTVNRVLSRLWSFGTTKKTNANASTTDNQILLKKDIVLAYSLVSLLVLITAAQISLIANVPLINSNGYYWLNRTLGIQRHHVFGDIHFNEKKRELALVYHDRSGREQWIPWITKDGYAGSEATGRFWVFWLRTSVPGAPLQQVWCAKAAESWAKREGIALHEGFVIVKVRRPDTRREWERDRYLKNLAIPWRDVMKLTWNDGQRQFNRIGLRRDEDATPPAKSGTGP